MENDTVSKKLGRNHIFLRRKQIIMIIWIIKPKTNDHNESYTQIVGGKKKHKNPKLLSYVFFREEIIWVIYFRLWVRLKMF